MRKAINRSSEVRQRFVSAPVLGAVMAEYIDMMF